MTRSNCTKRVVLMEPVVLELNQSFPKGSSQARKADVVMVLIFGMLNQ